MSDSEAASSAPSQQGDAAVAATSAPAAAGALGTAPLVSSDAFGQFIHRGMPMTAAELAQQKEAFGVSKDPTDATREVTNKRPNRVFLQHQKWKQEQIEKGLIDPATGKFVVRETNQYERLFVSTLTAAIKMFVIGLLLSLAAGQFVAGDPIWGYRAPWMSKKYWFPTPQRPFSVSELALYNGRSDERPIYLAIKGDVFDVSAKRYIYGPGGSYSFFAGRDASRAYVTGCFKEHLTHDVRGLTDEQLKTLDQWHDFFAKNDKYDKVGWVWDLPEIDPASPVPSKTCKGQPDASART